MAKLTLEDLASLSNETSVVNTINNNNAAIEAAVENTYSRDGTSPNTLEADLDANSQRILNLPNATANTEPLTYGQYIADGTTVQFTGTVVESFTSTSGQTLFTLTGYTYTIGASNLQVYVNGVKQLQGAAYTETSTSSFTFTEGLETGDVVEAVINQRSVDASVIQASSVTYDTNQDRSVQSRLEDFVSVKDYGAVGDGITDDTAAIQAMFDAATGATKFNLVAGETYLLSSTITVDDISVILEGNGATIKMAAGSTYNAFRFRGDSTGVATTGFFVCSNLTLDGNKNNQNWPDVPAYTNPYGSNDDSWDQTYGNTGLMGMYNFKDAVCYNVNIINKVSDGIVFRECANALADHCSERDGTQFNFSQWAALATDTTGRQATAFKGRWDDTSTLAGTLTVSNCTVQDGSIGVMASSPGSAGSTAPGSVVNIVNTRIENCVQNAILGEHSRKFFIDNVYCTSTSLEQYKTNTVDIGNETEYAYIDNFVGVNSQLDFRNGNGLIDGKITNSFLSYTVNTGSVIDKAIDSIFDVHDTVVDCNSLVAYGIAAQKNVIGCKVNDATTAGIQGAEKIKGCELIDCAIGGTNIKNDVIDCEITGGNSGVDFNASAGARVLGSNFSGQTLNPLNIGAIASIQVRGSTFTDWGTDTGATNPNRAAIGSSNANGCRADIVDIQGCVFDRTGGVANAYTQAVYSNEASGADRYRFVNNHVHGMTTANTIAGGYTDYVTDIHFNQAASATTPGTVTDKIRAYDEDGALIGYIAVYDGIS